MTIGHSHGLSVGVNTCGNILNVTFQDIVVNGTRDSRNYGIRVKGERGMGGKCFDLLSTTKIHF